MKTLNTSLLIFILAAFFYSCSPKPILEITTLENDKEYYNGNEVVGKSDSTALIFIEFIEQNLHQYIFYVQIENTSDRTYLFTGVCYTDLSLLPSGGNPCSPTSI